LILSGLEIIANHVTFSHRDSGNHHANLALADLHAELDYSPRAMVYIAGWVLEYSVGPWLNGEQVIIAHFMKDVVHDRVGVSRPSFSMQHFFLELVGGKSRKRIRSRR
jgi:hypothetical protein